MNLLKYKITAEIPVLSFTSKTIINTINPHSYVVAKNDLSFREALNNCDYLLPDGHGFVIAARIIHNINIKRITGADIHRYLLTIAEKEAFKVFYLGASEQCLQKIEKKISKEYPNIRLGYYSPPYKNEFSNEETRIMYEKVNAYSPQILFIGMTAPKQEKWVYDNQDHLNANVICSIGAVFDFFAGTVKRPGYLWQKLGLEWLIRLIRNPKKLWKRTILSAPIFLFDLLKTKFHKPHKPSLSR